MPAVVPAAQPSLPWWSRLCTQLAWTASDGLPVMRALQMDGFHTAMGRALGTPFRRRTGLEVFHLRHPQTHQCLFVKRSLDGARAGAHWRVLLQALCGGQPAHTESWHIHLAAHTLSKAGFRTMPIVAAGEERLLGVWPLRGFVVMRGATGQDAQVVHHEADTTIRRRLMGVLGAMAGRLHVSGFDLPIRLHDFFIEPAALQSVHWRDASPTMIHLDFKGRTLKRGPFDAQGALRALSHSAYLALRTGMQFDAAQWRAFAKCYARAVRAHGATLPRGAWQTVARGLREELTAHHRDEHLRAMFPRTPSAA